MIINKGNIESSLAQEERSMIWNRKIVHSVVSGEPYRVFAPALLSSLACFAMCRLDDFQRYSHSLTTKTEWPRRRRHT